MPLPLRHTPDSELLREIIFFEITREFIAASSADAICERIFERLANEKVRGILLLRHGVRI
jgi:hypothetical protein